MDAKPEWTVSPVLDLGWCVVRPITNEQWAYIGRVARPNRERAILACYAGITLRHWRRLTKRQREGLRCAAGWMLRPHLEPQVGRVVDPEAGTALLAPPRPAPTRKPYTRRTAV